MDLGLPAIPYLMEKMEAGDWLLATGVSRITRRCFHSSEYPEGSALGDVHTIARMLLAWWRGGREATHIRFNELWEKWRTIKAPGRTLLWTAKVYLYDDRGELSTPQAGMEFTAAGEIYSAIECLGIAALPLIVQTLNEGHPDLLPIALKLTDGAGGLGDPSRLPPIEDFLRWWEANKEDWLIPWPEEHAEE